MIHYDILTSSEEMRFFFTKTFKELANFHPKILRPLPKLVSFRGPEVELILSCSRWFTFPNVAKSSAFGSSPEA